MSKGSTNLTLLPDFTGDSVSYVQSYGSSHGIKINVTGNGSRVVSQSVPYGADIEFVKTLTINTGSTTTKKETEDDEKTTTKPETSPSPSPTPDPSPTTSPTPPEKTEPPVEPTDPELPPEVNPES